MPHKCPGPECPAQVPDHMLMCRPHWYAVPRSLRNDVWAAWNGGAGAGTSEHNEAMIAAIKSIKGHPGA
jgi:hypothetical protein